MQDAAGDPAAKVSHRAELERVVKELHRMCVAHPEALDVVTSRVCKLKYGRLQQIQVTLDALRDYALSDFIRLAVYCTSDLLAPCPIGKSVEAWQGSSRINLAYVTARQQLTAASAKDANSDRLAEEDRAGGEHAEQQQSPGGAQKLVAVDTPDQMLKYANLLRKGYTRPSRASILQRLHNAANRGGSKFRRLTIKHGLVHDASSPGGGRESEDGEAFVEELAAVKHTEAQDAPDTVEPSKLSYSGVPILPRPKLSIAEQIAAARHKIKAMPAALNLDQMICARNPDQDQVVRILAASVDPGSRAGAPN
ncbi:hypothetical protein WJX72_002238 [[Myrmecia] bisecta]|uniref:Uncharacterized protein n=1 Tax=[Myrmecia] bisecta TaxID=41462 RepID=A0AAW1Q0N2_9CHLO